MKALVCLKCSTIRSPQTNQQWTHCDCGQSAIRWVDPTKGIAEMWAVEAFYVRLLGLHNEILCTPQIVGVPRTGGDASWRHLHEVVCANADGYLFHKDRRNCWAVVTWPGESTDVTFRAEPPMADAAQPPTSEASPHE